MRRSALVGLAHQEQRYEFATPRRSSTSTTTLRAEDGSALMGVMMTASLPPCAPQFHAAVGDSAASSTRLLP
jgi:hypothetical protein